MKTVNGMTVIRKTRMAGKTGMQVWMTEMTGMTRISWLTKTTKLIGMPGVTGITWMKTVNGMTVIIRTPRMAGMTETDDYRGEKR